MRSVWSAVVQALAGLPEFLTTFQQNNPQAQVRAIFPLSEVNVVVVWEVVS